MSRVQTSFSERRLRPKDSSMQPLTAPALRAVAAASPSAEAMLRGRSCVVLGFPSASPFQQGCGKPGSVVAASVTLLTALADLASGFGWRDFSAFGVSTQGRVVQDALADRLGLTYPLMSDAAGTLARTLRLPMVRMGRRLRILPTLLVFENGVEVVRAEARRLVFSSHALSADCAPLEACLADLRDAVQGGRDSLGPAASRPAA
jgi:peroxiredoxin